MQILKALPIKVGFHSPFIRIKENVTQRELEAAASVKLLKQIISRPKG